MPADPATPPPPGPPRRALSLRRRLAYSLIMFVVLLGLGLTALEWYLRSITPEVLGNAPNYRGMYQLAEDGTVRTTPGWRGVHTVEGVTYPVRMNNLGMRGPDVGPKRPGERRVLVLGDSFVWGYGVADGDTFAAELERLLRKELGPDVTVGNAGAPGYGTRNQVEGARLYRDTFQPDAVLACVFLGNDFVDDTNCYEAVVDGFRLSGPMARLAERSWRARLAMTFRTALLVERFLDDNVKALALDRTSLAELTREEALAQKDLPPPPQRHAGLFMDRRMETAEIRTLLARVGESLRGVRELVAPAPVLCVVIPTMAHTMPGEFEALLGNMQLDPAEFENGVTGRRLAEVAAASGVRCLDLWPLLCGEEDPARNWQPVGRHFTAEGNRQVAAWLLPEVQALLDL